MADIARLRPHLHQLSSDEKAFTESEACNIVSSWLDQPNVSVIGAGDRFWTLLRDQILEAQVTGPLVTDARWLHSPRTRATLCSVDRDFRRFRGLKLIDPTDESALDP